MSGWRKRQIADKVEAHYSNTDNPVDFPRRFIVVCPECSAEHGTLDIEFLNVEENMQGRDVMFYVCPVTNTETSSLVYAK